MCSRASVYYQKRSPSRRMPYLCMPRELPPALPSRVSPSYGLVFPYEAKLASYLCRLYDIFLKSACFSYGKQMETWSLNARPKASIEPLISAIGTQNFMCRLFEQFTEVLPIERVGVFVYDHHGRPVWIAASTADRNLPPEESVAYHTDFYRLDQVSRWFSSVDAASQGKLEMALLDAREIRYLPYRTAYASTGLQQRVSLLAGEEGGGGLAINLYRSVCTPIHDTQLASLAELASLMTCSAKAHNRLSVPISAQSLDACRSILLTLDDTLSARELDVCARVLKGLTTQEIARDLNIAETSVVTYRKRAYRRLHVANGRELWSRCT